MRALALLALLSGCSLNFTMTERGQVSVGLTIDPQVIGVAIDAMTDDKEERK